MITVEICSLDPQLVKKLCKALETRLKEMNAPVKALSSDDCMLAQVVKLIKSYRSIAIDKNTLVFLETAREYQQYVENVKPLEKTDNIIIRDGSYLTNLLLLSHRIDVKKVTLKHLMRKIGKPPEFLFYVQPEINALTERRRKFTRHNSSEDSMKGMGIKSRNKKYPAILEKISSKYGTKCSIIEVEDNLQDLDPVVDALIKELQTNNIIKTN